MSATGRMIINREEIIEAVEARFVKLGMSCEEIAAVEVEAIADEIIALAAAGPEAIIAATARVEGETAELHGAIVAVLEDHARMIRDGLTDGDPHTELVALLMLRRFLSNRPADRRAFWIERCGGLT